LLDLVRRIQEAQDHLHQLYEEVRGYAAPIRLRCEPHDLLRLLETTWEHLSFPRQGRSASLQITACGGAATSTVDRFSIEQVFRNILENSLSACRDPVAITARFGTTELDGRPAVSIALADNGPGLTPEAQARIFEPFYTTKTRGTGLGMAITRRLVEAHGGRIRTGKASQGAEIVIELLREPFSESPP
jgi:signal transduction histidine kinase